jgi:rubrerythrin
MSPLPLSPLVRTATAAGEAAARFSRPREARAAEPAAPRFLAEMARDEDRHARQVEEFGRRLVAGPLPSAADSLVEGVESAPDWSHAQEVTVAQALDLAEEAELHAQLFYDTVADALEGPSRIFFRELAATEMEHARILVRMRLRLLGG